MIPFPAKKTFIYSINVALLCVLQSCNSGPNKEILSNLDADQLFSTIPSSYSGLHFNNQLDDTSAIAHKEILEYEYYFNGGGVAIGDINNDGLQDIFVTGNQVANKLYLNKGDLYFEDITEKAGFSLNRWSTGVSMADVNNDGYLDIYVCNSGPGKDKSNRGNEFYLNNGDLSFTEAANQFGIQDEHYSTQSAFFDYDKDGDLDLFVMNHSILSDVPFNELTKILSQESELKKYSNTLFQNNGDGSFTDITKQAGLQKYSYGLGLVISDINDDGWPDIYVSNDFDIPDFLFMNQKDGTFRDRIKWKTKHVSYNGMGCDIADINNDGAVDIAVVDMTPDDHFRSKVIMKSMDTKYNRFMINQLKRQHQYMFNSLQLNNGGEVFSDIAHMAGVAKTDWSWAALLSDFDNDGYKDYLVTNGFRKYSIDNDYKLYQKKLLETGLDISKEEFHRQYTQFPELKLPNVLYRNNTDLTFTNITEQSGMNQNTYSYGASSADLDGDGDLDLVIHNSDDELLLYRNNSNRNSKNNYLQIKLKGNALQAKVTLYHSEGEIQFQEVSTVRGYQSAVPQMLHFGLGDASKVDSLDIEWPDGSFQTEYNIAANQLLNIKKGTLKNKTKARPNYLLPMVNAKGLNIDYKHEENDHYDMAVEVLLPHSQSKLGPFSSVGDINGDGLDDIFIGGAKNQAGSIYIQNKKGSFSKMISTALERDKASEDMDALFFDADSDGDQDLYVVSGGGSDFDKTSRLLQDRLYLNNGSGELKKAKSNLPKMISSGAKVKASDIDQDGDLDLFIGGRTSPGQYPVSPRSYLLENKGGRFIDITSSHGPELSNIGMVTDFIWSDFNNDDHKDLIVVGEWMPVSFFENDGSGRFSLNDKDYMSEHLKGWWYSITAADLNADGKEDYILGNIGLNNKFHPSPEKPLKIYANDYDENGKLDIVFSSYYKGKEVPMRGKECSTQQMPGIEGKFPSFRDFANASLEDVYGKEKLKEGIQFSANNFHSTILIAKGDSFEHLPLPNEAQMSALNSCLVEDVDKDGIPDLIIAGNMFQTEFETTRYDASNGQLLKGKGDGTFEAVPFKQSGFSVPLDVKELTWFNIGNRNIKYILVTNNDMPIQVFRTR